LIKDFISENLINENRTIPFTLLGHKNYIIGVFFSIDSNMIYSISKDGALFIWKWINEKIIEKEKKNSLLVVGFANGVFGLYDLPEFNNIHTLSISNSKINTVAINSTGEWLAFGCQNQGQLLVWEWQSESYILKQQGHSLEMNCVCYSPNSQFIATGGDDGKIKIWNSLTGFCFITFIEHNGPITGLIFSSNGNAIFSSSLDGTVRAFDLIR